MSGSFRFLLFRPSCTLCGGNACPTFWAHGVAFLRWSTRLATASDVSVLTGKKVAGFTKLGEFGIDTEEKGGCIHAC